ncbi:hypothetical protein C9374_009585 [Naegleria lovaniensis]|uniref:Uncharacterized protein n=1 Tax=Naegleria lovaniensis TaxID=51637 RepID=A0AA88KPB4_NAELO|nr:uncharacterized protein C9374_009585 [Naegleria lovaniensis]KAG2393008.1 hypothetical protein C9374_009585 [Naegleria lovaniensis]
MGGIVSKESSMMVELGKEPCKELLDAQNGISLFSDNLFSKVPLVIKRLEKGQMEVEQFMTIIQQSVQYYKVYFDEVSQQAENINTFLGKGLASRETGVVHSLSQGLNENGLNGQEFCKDLDNILQDVQKLLKFMKSIITSAQSEYNKLEDEDGGYKKEVEKLKKRCEEMSKKLKELKEAPLTSLAEKTKTDFEIRTLVTYLEEDTQAIKDNEEKMRKNISKYLYILTHLEHMERTRFCEMKAIALKYFNAKKTMSTRIIQHSVQTNKRVEGLDAEKEFNNFIISCSSKNSTKLA